MSHDLLESIKGFVAVAEHGGFASAARHIHVSAPVLTKQIRWLEGVLQNRLFNRTTRQVELTEAGIIYLEHAKKIITDITEAQNAVLELEHEPHGNITIGISTELNGKFFSKKLQLFLEQYPKIAFTLSGKDDPNMIVEKQADLVVSWENVANTQLIKKELFPSTLEIYAAPSYIKKNGLPRSITDLQNHNCLININHPEWEFENKKIAVPSHYRSDASIDIYYAGMNALGLFQTLSILVLDEVKAKQLVEIKLDLTPAGKMIYLYYLPGHHDSITHLLAKHLLRFTSRYPANGEERSFLP